MSQAYICNHSKTSSNCNAKLYIDCDYLTCMATFNHIYKMQNHEFETECYKRMRNTLTEFQRE